MGIAIDVMERKALEQKLRESESCYGLLPKNALVGVSRAQDDLFRCANPALGLMFGYRPEEIIDHLGPLDLTHPDHRATVAENISRRVMGEIGSIHYSFRSLRRDGTTIACEVPGTRTERNRRPCVPGSLMDVPERKQAEAKMELLGTHNAPTGLYNCAFLTSSLRRGRTTPPSTIRPSWWRT